ncbi:MAG: DUF1566 domain-containing protein [Nitrospinales bacterium]
MMKSLTSISTFVLTALLSQQLIADEMPGRPRFNLETGQLIVPCLKVNDPGGENDGRYFKVTFKQNGNSFDFISGVKEEDEVCRDPNLKYPPSPGFETVLKICGNSETPQWGGQCRYAVGDTGPAGGGVFYVTNGGLQGLEAANEDLGTAEWGCSGTETGAMGEDIGTGASNTAAILEANCGGDAAQLAANYKVNGYTGWFLPSRDELHQMYLRRAVLGGFVNDLYWASSEYNSDLAWTLLFNDGGHGGYGDKREAYKVRAVRGF